MNKLRILFVGNPSNGCLIRWLTLLPKGTDIEVFAPKSAENNETLLDKQYRHEELIKTIKKFKPDFVHSIGTMDTGPLVLAARADTKFYWIATSVGDDFGPLADIPKQRGLIRKVTKSCDRFVSAAESSVYSSLIPPDGMGFVCKWRDRTFAKPPSERRQIILEGNFGLYGRSLVALAALERCRELILEYEIIVVDAGTEVRIAAELFQASTGICVKYLPGVTSADHLKRYESAALSLNLSICGGIHGSLLETMFLGAIPIESHTSCADKWIEHQKTGFLVDPDDPRHVESAIRAALAHPALLDCAAKSNRTVIEQRWSNAKIVQAMANFYSRSVC